jgi:alkylated DNA repair dioxygenase AlkB
MLQLFYRQTLLSTTWDNMKSLGKNITIASLSFGAERKFSFKHKQTKQTVSLVLEHGSLLIMKDATHFNICAFSISTNLNDGSKGKARF